MHFHSLDTKIENNSRAFKLQKANFDSEVNTAVISLNLLQALLHITIFSFSCRMGAFYWSLGP